MSTTGLDTALTIAAGVGVWLAAGTVTGMALGRILHRRDRQVPRPPDDGTEPTPRCSCPDCPDCWTPR